LDKHLHIVTLDVPLPADYGGAIDQFFKILWLHKLGVKIHLHCFSKDRQPTEALDQYCESVHYYQRKLNLSGFSLQLPYIVSSRNVAELLHHLQQDQYPILLEGIHSTYFLQTNQLQGRKVFVRLHNTEYKYYSQLAKHEKKIFDKLYYTWESFQLKKYETKLCKTGTLLAISQTDKDEYETKLHAGDVHFLPAFVGWEKVTSQSGTGCYCLYHGNLSISENEEVVLWLLQNVFSQLVVPFVVAGKNPSDRLSFLAHQHEHTCLVANPTEKELQDIIAKAQINILPSFNNTGVKLKLLNALYSGRHCIVNNAGVEGSGLESLCNIVEDAEDFKTAINYLYQIPFAEREIEKRRMLLEKLNSNKTNAEKMMTIIWPA